MDKRVIKNLADGRYYPQILVEEIRGALWWKSRVLVWKPIFRWRLPPVSFLSKADAITYSDRNGDLGFVVVHPSQQES